MGLGAEGAALVAGAAVFFGAAGFLGAAAFFGGAAFLGLGAAVFLGAAAFFYDDISRVSEMRHTGAAGFFSPAGAFFANFKLPECPAAVVNTPDSRPRLMAALNWHASAITS